MNMKLQVEYGKKANKVYKGYFEVLFWTSPCKEGGADGGLVMGVNVQGKG